MKVEAAVLLVAGVCACHKREDATPIPVTTDPVAATTASTTLVASPAPSETAAASASASAGSGNVDPHIARQAALQQATELGMIGLINGGHPDPNAPIAPWGRDDSLGNDPLSARGNMWGNQIGDAFGDGGIGVGEGRGEGIGLGNIGSIGHGAGTGTGQGFGSGSGRLGGTHTGPTPKVRQGAVTVNGRLPPEVIQRIARQNFGRFRLCYENGLRTDPKLAGTVATKFVIAADGSVSSSARDNSTTMTDTGVVSCVTRAFSGLSFPQPEGGIVVVIYPVIFSPGD